MHLRTTVSSKGPNRALSEIQVHLHGKPPGDVRISRRHLNGYEPSTPRATLGLAAVAMTAITMGALVVLPAKLDSVSADPYPPATARTATKASVEVAISPTRIDARGGVTADEDVRPGPTTLGAQEFRGMRRRSISRSRTST